MLVDLSIRTRLRDFVPLMHVRMQSLQASLSHEDRPFTLPIGTGNDPVQSLFARSVCIYQTQALEARHPNATMIAMTTYWRRPPTAFATCPV